MAKQPKPTKQSKPAKQFKPMGMFLQDPSLPELHDDFDFAETEDFLEGSGSSRFCVRDASLDPFAPIIPTLAWESDDLSFARFEKENLTDDPQFHQVNVFAVCTRTLRMVEQELGSAVDWQGGGPLIIRPHAFDEANAFYTRGEPGDARPSLNFGVARSDYRRAPAWMCLSHDVVSHELGHAVLDNIRPDLFESAHPDSGALHESFGDLTALFAALQYEPVVRRLFQDSGGDLRKTNVLSRMGEEFGLALKGGGFPYLRSALDGPHYGDDAPTEVHERSVIWTGAMYELMVRLVEARTPEAHPGYDTFVTMVIEAARWTRGMLYRALHYTPPTTVTLPQLARLIWEADARVFPGDSEFRDIAREVFTERGLWDPTLDFAVRDIGADFEKLVGADTPTLSRAVMNHADALRIPRALGARILTPTLVSTTRRVDKVKNDKGRARRREITEHYLCYRYELEVPVVVSLPDGPVELILPLVLGGTLVLDDTWHAVLLATDPIITAADKLTDNPVKAAVTRSIATLQTAIQDQLPPALDLDPSARGGLRANRPLCDFAEHVRRLSARNTLFPFAPAEPPKTPQ